MLFSYGTASISDIKTGHFGDVLPSKSLRMALKKLNNTANQ